MVRHNQAQSISLSAIDEQRFTKVSSEQAAVVEGELQVVLTSIHCKSANGGFDDVYAIFNGVKANTQWP